MLVLKYLGIKTIYFGGGEPFLHNNLIEIIDFAKKLQIIPSISTNGSLINKKILSKLYGIGFKHNFYISLDGPNESINDLIRGKGSFKKTIAGIDKLSQYKKIQFALTMVLTKININYIDDMILLAKNKGARFLNLNKIAINDGRAKDFKEILNLDQKIFSKKIKKLKKKFKCNGEFFGECYSFSLNKNDPAIFINNTKNNIQKKIPLGISIGYDGKVQFTPMKIVIGDYNKTGSIKKIVEDAMKNRI